MPWRDYGSWWRRVARVQESGHVGMGSAAKIDSWYLAGKMGFSSSYQIPLISPIYSSVSFRKNVNNKFNFMWSQMIKPVAKQIFQSFKDRFWPSGCLLALCWILPPPLLLWFQPLDHWTKPSAAKLKGAEMRNTGEFTSQTDITFETEELEALRRFESNILMEMLEEGREAKQTVQWG